MEEQYLFGSLFGQILGFIGICVLFTVMILAYRTRAKMAETKRISLDGDVLYLKEINRRLEEKTEQLEYLYKDQVQFSAALSQQLDQSDRNLFRERHDWKKVVCDQYRDRIKIKACYEYSPRELINYRTDLKDIHNKIVLDSLHSIAKEILKQKMFIQNEFQTAVVSPYHDTRRGIIEVEVLRPKEKE
jgi:hypothetical protein